VAPLTKADKPKAKKQNKGLQTYEKTNRLAVVGRQSETGEF